MYPGQFRIRIDLITIIRKIPYRTIADQLLDIVFAAVLETIVERDRITVVT